MILPLGFIATIILGGIAGWLASIIMKTNASMGMLANIVVGVIGALLGSWVFTLLGGHGADGFNVYSLLVATVGAVILLAILKAVRRGPANS